jgi:hypothetical protein
VVVPALDALAFGFLSSTKAEAPTRAFSRRYKALPEAQISHRKVCGMLFGPRNAEEHIRELCGRLLLTENPEEIAELADQLRSELRACIANLRGMVLIHHPFSTGTKD